MDNQKDNKNNDPLNDPIKWKSLGFFSAEEYLLYVFKKTEKITSALYLVSGLIKDDEPLKWELRHRGMDLLSSSFTASSSLPGDKNVVIQSLFTAALETVSILNVARISGLVSDMNHAILVKEIDQVLVMLRDRLAESAENAGYILSESFFKTPSLFSSGFAADVKSGRGALYQDITKGQPGTVPQKAQVKVTHTGEYQNSTDKKTKRQEEIVSILKEQSNLSVKDFTRVIKDCSEKTIQRELLDLVEKGIVKKEGERRWSRYSLK
jgi:predicted transcriptional regulator